MRTNIVIGTRPSTLAVIQAELVRDLLIQHSGRPIQLKKITTKGDKIRDRSLVAIGGKGLFLKEIEEELLAGRVDLAVHSMKDVPFAVSKNLVFPCLLERADPRDAFVSNRYTHISEMPVGCVVGTTSLRRIAQLKQTHPHLRFVPTRGNVETRLKKLDDGQVEALVLACAGLTRLQLEKRITAVLDLVPAVGQGAIGVECRADDEEMIAILKKLNHEPTQRCVALERIYVRKLEGDCQTPLGCWVQDDGPRFQLKYFYTSPQGKVFSGECQGLWSEGEETVDDIILHFN